MYLDYLANQVKIAVVITTDYSQPASNFDTKYIIPKVFAQGCGTIEFCKTSIDCDFKGKKFLSKYGTTSLSFSLATTYLLLYFHSITISVTFLDIEVSFQISKLEIEFQNLK